MCILYDAGKHGCDHHYAVNRSWIHLKIRCHDIHTSRLFVNATNEGTPDYDVASRVDEIIVTDLTGHAVATVVELSLQPFVNLQTVPYLTKGS